MITKRITWTNVEINSKPPDRVKSAVADFETDEEQSKIIKTI